MFQRFLDLKKVEKHWPNLTKGLNPAGAFIGGRGR